LLGSVGGARVPPLVPAAMRARAPGRMGAGLLACAALRLLAPDVLSFASLRPSTLTARRAGAATAAGPGDARRVARGDAEADPLLPTFCGGALAGAVAGCARAARVAMRSGRFVYGQSTGARPKGCKKVVVYRPREPPGRPETVRLKRRYEVFDDLERIHEELPSYTVIEEPEEAMEPVEDAPLLERYPWAGSLESVPQEFVDKENDIETALEPLFASITGRNLPPMGRRQNLIHRTGFPTQQHPPWLNSPLAGHEVTVDHFKPWSKDRRPTFDQLGPLAKEEYLKRQAGKPKSQIDTEDDLDAELDAMGGED